MNQPISDSERDELRASMNKDYLIMALTYLSLAATSLRIIGLANLADELARLVQLLKAEQARRDPSEKVM